jgi:hypothetical protein
MRGLTVAILLMASSAQAQQFHPDESTAKHFAIGGSIGMSVGALRGPVWAGAGATAMGLAKEIRDSRAGGTGFNTLDLASTAMGGILGGWISHRLTTLINKRKRYAKNSNHHVHAHHWDEQLRNHHQPQSMRTEEGQWGKW